MTESMVNVCEHNYVKENLAMSSLLLICILCYPVLSVGTQIYLVDFYKFFSWFSAFWWVTRVKIKFCALKIICSHQSSLYCCNHINLFAALIFVVMMNFNHHISLLKSLFIFPMSLPQIIMNNLSLTIIVRFSSTNCFLHLLSISLFQK